MMQVNYIICAAGAGSRFKASDINTPKSLIILQNKCLLEWSINSLPIYPGDNLIIITQKQDQVKTALFDKITQDYFYCNIHWIEIDRVTKGQLSTALMAEQYLDLKKSIAIYNCDTYFRSRNLTALFLDPAIEGIIPCSKEQGSAWSFCKIDGQNNVLDIQEKQRISPWASVGLYFFRDTAKFLSYARQELEQDTATEYYVSHLYKHYLQDKCKVVIEPVEVFRPMGTPEQILEYWGIHLSELITTNSKKVLVVDLDNTITIEDSETPYPNKKPNLHLIEKLTEYRNNGYKIIIYTARRMNTHANDEAALLADIAQITITWLKKHNVPFDGIKFGKPYAENGFYIDDKSIRPNEFLTMSETNIINKLNLKKRA